MPEAWMLRIKKHNRGAVRQRTAEGAKHWVNSKDLNAPIRADEKTTDHGRASCFIRSRMTSRPHRLKKTSSMQSKRRDLDHTWLHRETNEKTQLLLLFTTMNNQNLFCEQVVPSYLVAIFKQNSYSKVKKINKFSK